MNIINKVFSLVVVLVLYSTQTKATILSGTCGDNAFFVLNDDGLLHVYGSGEMSDFAAPWSVVRSQIKNVTIGDSITSVGNSSFAGCSNIVNVELPNTLTRIGDNAFSSCEGLVSINIPSNLTYIGSEAFRFCLKLSSEIVIPGGVRYIRAGTFHYCPSLRNVVIQDGVETIDDEAFAWCYGLAKINFPSSLKKIGVGAFNDCHNIKELVFKEGLTEIGSEAFIHCSGITKLVTPSTLVSIGKSAFMHCTSLSELSLANGLQSIGEYAFCGCISLTSLKLPDSVNFIGESAFSGLNNGTGSPSFSVVQIGNGLKEISSVFRGLNQPSIDTLVIGNSITSIYDGVSIFGSKYGSPALSPKCFLITNNIVTLSSLDYQKKGGYTYNTPSCNIFVVDSTLYSETQIKTYGIRNIISSVPNTEEYTGNAPNINLKSNIRSYTVEIDSSCYNIGTYTSMKINVLKDDFLSTINVPCHYTITKAPLTIIANDKSIYYGEEIPTLDYTCIGLKNNETPEYALSVLPVLVTSAKKGSDVGTYEINIGGATAMNYSLSYKTGTITIKKATQRLTWNQTFGNCYIGDAIELSATSSCGLPISYTSSDESVAFVTKENGKHILHLIKEGIVKISATQLGDSNHEAAEEINKMIQVIARMATSISLSQTTATIKVGEQLTLTATIKPESTINKGVSWSSSDTGIATVDNNGVVTAVKVGTATITATTTDGTNLSATCKVTVDPVLATSISLSRTSASIKSGATLQLTCTLKPDNVTSKAVKWSSSNTDIATVDNNGMVTAVKVGTATITATTTDGTNLSATCKVTVDPVLATSISLSRTSASIKSGATLQLTCTLKPDNVTSKAVKWSSSNTSIATVDSKGVVTAVKVGTATITATTTDGSNLSATCKVTVDPILATSISLSQTSASIKSGATLQLTCTLKPDNVTSKAVKWSSSNTGIATVDNNGMVTAIKVGTATITATTTDGTNLSATCKVTVDPVLATSISLSRTSASIKSGATLQLTCTLKPDNVTSKAVKWSSSNTSIATVDSKGVVTAVKVGTATITATTTDGSNLSATCKVTVDPVLATSISLSRTSASVKSGATLQLICTLKPDNVTSKAVKWSSSNTGIATVDNNGMVTAVKVGTATITATTTDGSNLSATCKVTVDPILATSISISSSSLDLEVGHSATLSATVLPENATNKNKEWSSSNPNIATVSEGIVTAVSPGTCVIKVKTVDGSNLTSTCTIVVADIPVSTLSIDKTSIDLLVEEETLITASVYPANATNKALVWSSSNGNVASVDNGKVKALNAGSAVISVRTTDGSDKRETCNVTVRKHPQTIEWNQDLSYITYGGELIELKAVASSGLPVVFSSSNDNVASIFDMGSVVYLNPVNPGISKITATQGGNYYYESVSVVKEANVVDPNEVEDITDSSEKYTIYDIAGLLIGTYTQQEYDELISNKSIPAGIYIVNGLKKFIGK